MGKVGHDICHL